MPRQGTVLAWTGVGLAITGNIPTALLIWNQETVVAGLIFILVAAIVSTLFVVRWLLIQPPFTLLDVSKTLTLHDKDGEKATHSCTRTARANHKGITEFWFKDIGPADSAENIVIDGKLPDLERTALGNKGVGKHYPRGLHWRQKIEHTVSLDITAAFPDEREFYTHKVMDKTKKIDMVVQFHPDRPCRSACVYLQYGGAPFEEIKDANLERSESGEGLKLSIRKPNLGEEYRLEWLW